MVWIEQGWVTAARVHTRIERLLGRLAGASAQSTVEYALVGALVVIAAAGALSLLGNELYTVFTNITNKLAGK